MTPLLPTVQNAINGAKPFQLVDATWLAQNKKAVLGHKTGLGKTYISLLAWSQWSNVRRVLIVGTSASINTWRRIIKQWGGGTAVIMQGSGDPGWTDLMAKKSGIWLCTYATFRILMNSVQKPKHINVDLLINDELHKSLRGRNATFAAMQRVDCEYYIGATATWQSKGPQDLFPVLHIIDRKMFPSYWRFVNTWCYVTDASYGKEIFGVKNADKLRELLRRSYYRSRTWKEVGGQFRADGVGIDPVVRRTEIIPMSREQELLYASMDSSMEAKYRDQFVLAQNSLVKLTKLLQLAVSPRLLFDNGPLGGGIEWLTDKLLELDAAVVFVPFKELAFITAKHLFASGYEGQIYNLYGGVTPDECDATVESWRKTKGVVFCTIAYAQSFPLDVADYAYFLGFDWDPNNNIQAEGRLRRADSVFDVPCLATYIVMEGTVYEQVKDVINGKVTNVRQVMADYGV